MGHKITQDGLQSDPEKVEAILKMPAPQSVEELRRYMGMVNYLAKFLPNLADVLTPLQNLLRKEVPWNWSTPQEDAFTQVQNLLTSTPVLAIYDPAKDLKIENDASEYGLGTALYQDGKPVAFASRALSSAEKRYAQIEKEMLAVCFGLEKFHHYTYGRKVEVVTDHKPLVAINQKPLSRAPKRLQAMLLRALTYDFNLSYAPGKSIPVTDTLSQAPVGLAKETESLSVNSVSFVPIKGSTLNEI